MLGTLAFLACFFGWACFELWVNLRGWRAGSVNRDGLTRYLIIAGMLLAFVLAVVAAQVPALDFSPARRSALFWLGLGLMAAGLAFRLYAIAQLGHYFVPEVAIQPGQQLVERGFYRCLRHPSYTGILVTSLGFALALGNWLSVGVMAAVPGLVLGVRMRLEEAALLEAFGVEYRAYMRRTKRLIPFVF